MKEQIRKRSRKARRLNRSRARISGTPERPRLVARLSNYHVSAQIIDDQNARTLVASTTIGQKRLEANLTKRAAWVGEDIAKKAKTAKIKSVVLDRGHKTYHGRLKALAEAARTQGLEF